MALDFPSNPTDGQVYGSYIYSTSAGVWKAKPSSATVATTSQVPPSTANNGDIWIDTSDGIAYFYYDDGTSTQWVEVMSSGVPSLNTKANLAGGNSFTGTQTFGTPLAIGSGGTGNNSGVNLVPTGCIMMWYTNTPPSGWLLCNGQSTTGYTALAAVVGATVPNLQGRVPVGRDAAQTEFDVLGEIGGAKSVTLTANQSGLRDHRHQMRAGSATVGGTEDGFARSASPGDDAFRTGIAKSIGTGNAYNSADITKDALEAHNNLQPYIVLNYIIKT